MVGYYTKLYAATMIAFVVIDIAWLGLAVPTLYRPYLGFLMAPNPNWAAVIIFYLLFVTGLLVFVIVPGLQVASLPKTLLRAALFGLVTYGTYELTNLATLRDWPAIVTVVDILWGASLSVLVSFISFRVGQWPK